MGRNNQQRRAAKARAKAKDRRSSTPSGSAFGMPGAGPSGWPFAGPTSGWASDDELAMSWLHRLMRLNDEGQRERAEEASFEVSAILASPGGRRSLVGQLNRMLTDGVHDAWRLGWQPADLLRLAARNLGAIGSAVVGDAVAAQLSRYAAQTVTPSWHDQLTQAGAGVWWPRDTDPLTARASSAPDGLVSVLTEAVRAADLLAGLPTLQRLDPLPGTWRPARHTGAGRGERAAPVDARLLDRVRALLAKAESTTFEAEAETFTAGAQSLMARHSIDQAMLAASSERLPDDGPSARRVGIDRPYETPKVLLLDVVATANRCRTVWSESLGFVTVIGFPSDLEASETIFTSLLLQSTRAMTRHGSRTTRGGQSRTRSFRQSFLTAFAHRIGQRLSGVTEEETASARARAREGGAEARAAGPSRDLVHVLAERANEVDATVDELFPQMVHRSAGAANDHEGWWAGVQAADSATLFGAAEQLEAGG